MGGSWKLRTWERGSPKMVVASFSVVGQPAQLFPPSACTLLWFPVSHAWRQPTAHRHSPEGVRVGTLEREAVGAIRRFRGRTKVPLPDPLPCNLLPGILPSWGLLNEFKAIWGTLESIFAIDLLARG